MLNLKYMEYKININELILLIKNILNNDNIQIKTNGIFKDIIDEYENIKEQYETISKVNNKLIEENKIMSDEITNLKLYTSSLEECINPNDKTINYLYIKNQNLKFKYDGLKNKLNKLVKQNYKLMEDNKNIIELHNINIIKLKEKYINERKELNDNLKKDIETLKNKFEDEINILNMSKEEQNKIIQNMENNINNKNSIIEEKNNQIEELKYKLSKCQTEITDIKNTTDNKINILETDNKTLQKKILTLNNQEIKQNNNMVGGGGEIVLNCDNIGIWEQKNINKKTLLKNKMFFDNEIKAIEKKKIEEIENKQANNTNISFSTDYMVSFLHNDNKLIPKEERINIINKNLPFIIEESKEMNNNDENNLNSNIFLKNKFSYDTSLKSLNNSTTQSEQDKYIDVSKINNIIINTENTTNTHNKIKELQEFIKLENNNNLQELQDIKILIPEKIEKKQEIKKHIEPLKPEIKQQINNIIGGSNSKMKIHLIDGIKKMVIGEEMTTLTEQDINIDDKKVVHLTYNKKFKRYKREQDKNNKLMNELK